MTLKTRGKPWYSQHFSRNDAVYLTVAMEDSGRIEQGLAGQYRV